MTIRSRIALLLNVKTSSALDQVEDPREVLDYAYGQQREQLQYVKRGRVEVATAKHLLERQAEQLRTRVARHEDQARRALRAGRDDLARAALERKQTVLAELSALARQIDEVARDESRLAQADTQLSERVERFRVHRTIVTARYAAASAQVAVGERLAGLAVDEETELTLAVERSEEKVDRLQARAAAIETLTDVGSLYAAPPVDPIERELNEIGGARAVDDEIAALKRELENEGETA